MYKYVLLAAVPLLGCATEDPVSLTPPQPTFVPEHSRWEADYRTGSRLPVRNGRVSSTVQPVQQFDALEFERQRGPMGDHRGP